MTTPKIKDPRKRRMLFIMIPVFITCFIMLFWLAFTVTRSKGKDLVQPTDSSAFNVSLPDAKLPDVQKNKMELYMEAAADSIDEAKRKASDPYLSKLNSESHVNLDQDLPTHHDRQLKERMDKRLSDLYQGLDEAQNQPGHQPPTDNSAWQRRMEEEIMQLLDQKKTMQANQHKEDDMAETAAMINQLHEIVYPEKNTTTRQAVKPALKVQYNKEDTVQYLQYRLPDREGFSNSFYGINSGNRKDSARTMRQAVRAVVHETQTIQDKSTIKLRLLQPIYISGTEIPKDQLVTGICAIQNERLIIRLDRIIYKDEVFPIALTVLDGIDGQIGLHIPGAVTRDVAKADADRSIQSLGMSAFDPSIQAQAAAAAIETGKNLISRKVRNVQVVAKAGDVLLLKNLDEF